MLIFGKKEVDIAYTKRQGIYGVIFHEYQEKVGLIRANGNVYFLPGGGIEAAETHEECLIREVREEMGTEIHIGTFIGRAGQYFYSPNSNRYLFNEGYFYLCTRGKYICEPLEENEIFQWIDIKEAESLLIHDHQQWALKQGIALYKKDK